MKIRYCGIAVLASLVSINTHAQPVQVWAFNAPPESASYVRVPYDIFTTDSVSAIDVDGLTFTAQPWTAYSLSCHLATATVTTTTAVMIGMNGPASPLSVSAVIAVNNSSLAWHTSYLQGYETFRNATTSSSALTGAVLWATIENGPNAGPVSVRLKSEVPGSPVGILRGSICEMVSLGSVVQTPASGLALASLGDSKTLGPGSSTGYRWELAKRLNTAEVGAYAVGGLTAQVLASAVDGWISGMPTAPDRVLLNIGANDLPTMPAGYRANVEYVVDAVHAAWPSAKVYVALPWRRGYDANADTMAGLLGTVIAARSTWCFTGPDERAYLKWTDDGATRTVEGVHPNQWGYHLTALEWLTVVSQ